VLIVTCLPFARHRYLCDVVGQDHRVVAAESWADFLERVLTLRPHVVVVDPTPMPQSLPIALDAISAASARVPVLLYTPLSPTAARAVQSLRGEGQCLWVLEGIDDDPVRFRATLARHRRAGGEEALVVPLLAALGAGKGTAALSAAIRDLFRAPARYRTAQDLARSAGMSLRWLNARLHAAGLASAGAVVAAARVYAAFEYLRDGALSVGQVAEMLRYPDAKSLRRHALAFTALVPSAWADTLTDEACIARLAARLRVRPDRPLVLVPRAARNR